MNDIDDIDAYNEDGRTPLMEAVYEHDVQRVIELLKHGANKDLKDGTYGTSTALNIAKREFKKHESEDLELIIKALSQESTQSITDLDALKESSLPTTEASKSNNSKKDRSDEIVELLQSINSRSAKNKGSSISSIDIPMFDLVLFLIKLGFASIPAVIIVFTTVYILMHIASSISA